MATLTSLSLSSPRVVSKATEAPKAQPAFNLNNPWGRAIRVGSGRMQAEAQPAFSLNNMSGRTSRVGSGRMQVRAAPESLSDKVVDSIKSAEELCAGDPESGECVAAWDEVEELSAAVSHAKADKKDSDPLEAYCKDNPETNECRTYDN